jgi:long-subunit acyl-CoA synthetase (AMP-forming)
MGNGRTFLTAIVTGEVSPADVERALAQVNPQLPHYKRIHGFHISKEPFSAENGLLTVNGKLKRDAIAARYGSEIEALYQKQSV